MEKSNDVLAQEVRDKIGRGFVLCIDPDYLLLHYGDITVGTPLPTKAIGPRYAVCVGTDGEATFWSMLSTTINDHCSRVPDTAKSGAFTKNAKPSYYRPDQLWVMTREMAVEAHIQVNGPLRPKFRFSYIDPELVPDWPSLPPVYPKQFTRKGLTVHPKPVSVPVKDPKESLPPVEAPAPLVKVDLVAASPLPLPMASMETPMSDSSSSPKSFDQGAWVRLIREDRGMSRDSVCGATGGVVSSSILARVESNDRFFTEEQKEAWRVVLNIPKSEPNLGLLTLKEVPRLLHSDAPATAPKVEILAAREDMVADVVRLLNNKRLTDDEAKAFGARLKADIIHLLLGDD